MKFKFCTFFSTCWCTSSVKSSCFSNLYSLHVSLYYHPFPLEYLAPFHPQKKDKPGLTRRSRLHISTWDKSTKNMHFKWMAADRQTGQSRESRTMQPFSLPCSLQLSALTDLLFSRLWIIGAKSEQAVNKGELWLEENPVMVLKATVTLLVWQPFSWICSSCK